MGMPALCVFHNQGAHFLRRFMKSGFQHCFLAVASGDYWIVLDSKMGAADICVLAGSKFDLAGFYRDEGFTVVETFMGEEAKTATLRPTCPLMLATCVGMTKRLLGLNAPGVFTPWQLCRRLTKDSVSS